MITVNSGMMEKITVLRDFSGNPCLEIRGSGFYMVSGRNLWMVTEKCGSGTPQCSRIPGGSCPLSPNRMTAAAPENTARAPPHNPGATVRAPRIPGMHQKMAPLRRSNAG